MEKIDDGNLPKTDGVLTFLLTFLTYLSFLTFLSFKMSFRHLPRPIATRTNKILLTDWNNKRYYYTEEYLETTPDYTGKYWKKLVGFNKEGDQWDIIIRTTRKDFEAREADFRKYILELPPL